MSDTALVLWNPEQQAVIKDTICPGITDAEMVLFAHVCRHLGLDPFLNQIHAIRRNSREQVDGQWKSVAKMTIQTSIHGLRLIADRTGNYAPGRQPTFEVDERGKLISATAYVLKYAHGQWHEVADTAFWDEYVQTNRDDEPVALWKTKPRVMLAKCSESLALRRAFPAEMAGVYTDDEMPVADVPKPPPPIFEGEVITTDEPPEPRRSIASPTPTATSPTRRRRPPQVKTPTGDIRPPATGEAPAEELIEGRYEAMQACTAALKHARERGDSWSQADIDNTTDALWGIKGAKNLSRAQLADLTLLFDGTYRFVDDAVKGAALVKNEPPAVDLLDLDSLPFDEPVREPAAAGAVSKP